MQIAIRAFSTKYRSFLRRRARRSSAKANGDDCRSLAGDIIFLFSLLVSDVVRFSRGRISPRPLRAGSRPIHFGVPRSCARARLLEREAISFTRSKVILPVLLPVQTPRPFEERNAAFNARLYTHDRCILRINILSTGTSLV